ncbi:deleted in lung and esophageal cancer protein 1 [Sorex araneus]|uniref:deleted in lung and esophageal cancer protein 1 n=1 Tax=Sorex araneus TaxID=42254 RepID=UPI002433B2AE|nr:deleted in lung and esophageal cancer protein 1 [Sorex araneus]
METGQLQKHLKPDSRSYTPRSAARRRSQHLGSMHSPIQDARLSPLAYSDTAHHFAVRPRFLTPLLEPQMLRLRPTSLLSQDISHLLTRVFRNLYTAEVIGEELSANLIKARGSEDESHEKFVDELQEVRELYKRRLDEVDMLEKHIIQARARTLAEKERCTQQPSPEDLGSVMELPPVKNIFPWYVDSDLLQKHHLICPQDYHNYPVPFCSAPKGSTIPGYTKMTFSFEKKCSLTKQKLAKRTEASLKKLSESKEESDHTVSNQTGVSATKAKVKPKGNVTKAGLPRNKRWMNHLRMPQRKLERLLLARMESRNDFLKNPRFFPPNTLYGGTSLLFPLKNRARREFQNIDQEQSCADTPIFLAKPPIGFFTDYEIGPVYEMVISLQNTTSTSRYLRVLPPSTPYFSVSLGMFPGNGGLVAPGLMCQFVVQFFPDCLGDFDDFILVETQSSHTLLIPLQARRPPPVLTLSPELDCGFCLIGGIKLNRFLCKNVGLSGGKFCIMPKGSWPPPSFRAIATAGFVEQPPFGIWPMVFELAPGQTVWLEVIFLPTSPGRAEKTFLMVCDNCQVKDLVISGVGQLVALELISVSGERSQPEAGELTDLTAQHFIRFEPINLGSVARKQLIIRNATHVELPFHWQILKPNLQALLPGEAYSPAAVKCIPDRDTAFSITPHRGVFRAQEDHEFILTFAPHELRPFHSVMHLVLEEIPEPVSSDTESTKELSYSLEDRIILEVEVKGTVEPFQVLLDPYAILLPGENYIGSTVKRDFKMWNNSKSPISYVWGKISDCHIVEVEPCTGTIEPSEVECFELNVTGGVPGPMSEDLPCEIRNSPWPVMLHIEAAFKGPALVINTAALQLGLLRLGQKVSSTICLQNISQLPAVWQLRESPLCLEERGEAASPFCIEPCSGLVPPLGDCSVQITLEALSCQRLQTVLELEVDSGVWSYLPVYAEVQEPFVYLQSSHVELHDLYVGVPAEATVTLVNGTLLPTQFHWDVLLGNQASFCRARISPSQGILSPNEVCQLQLELTALTQEELTDLALPCYVSGMEKPLVLGLSGKPQGLRVTIGISAEDCESRVSIPESWPGSPEVLHLDFGSAVPLRTCVSRQLVLTNLSPIETTFTLHFKHFESPPDILSQKRSPPDLPPTLLKMPRIRTLLDKRESMDFMEAMLSHGKGAAFFPHLSCGVLGAHQQLQIHLTACANMWGEYRDSLTCEVGELAPVVIPVSLAVVGCPISSQRITCYTGGQLQKEPIIRFGTQLSGGSRVTRMLRLSNTSPCDIRLDWQTFIPDSREDQLLDLLVFHGPPFPLRDQDGNEILQETPESSVFLSPALSMVSGISQEAETDEGSWKPRDRAAAKVVSVVLQEHEGVASDYPYSIRPLQTVVPAGGSSTIYISFTPVVLDPRHPQKVECAGFALGFMSLDEEVEIELPGQRWRGQDFAVGPLRLDLHSFVRPAQLSVEPAQGLVFQQAASDLLPQDLDSEMLSELVTTQHLKLVNTSEIPYHFHLTVSEPFTLSQGAGRGRRRASQRQEWQKLGPRENMLVDVSFLLSLELLSYQKLPAEQLPPGVALRHCKSGEKALVFTRDLLLEYTNRATQVVPLQATVTLPRLQLSTSWVDFGTCFVKKRQVRELCLENLSSCRSYWVVLKAQEKMDADPGAFSVSPKRGLLEARQVNGPPASVVLKVCFTARMRQEYECTLLVKGMLGEDPCVLRVRGQGSHDEKHEPLPGS